MSRQASSNYTKSSSLPGSPGNGSSGSSNRPSNSKKDPSGDLYQQLIESNDLVKELDDIEAISQQISQHAEVLYQSWKSNAMGQQTGGGRQPNQPQQQFKLPSSNGNRSNGGVNVPSSGPTYGGAGFPKRSLIVENGSNSVVPYHKQNGGGPISPPVNNIVKSGGGNHMQSSGGNSQISSDTTDFSANRRLNAAASTMPRLNVGGTSPLKSSASPLSAPAASLTSPSFIASKSATLPTPQPQKPPDQVVGRSLELLASPEVNGSLKELVNSFVSTDRAKQAARQTISSTITNQMNRRAASANGGLRSPSPTSSASSPFSSRCVSPLRSPMLATAAASSAAGPLSPSGSSTSSTGSSTMTNMDPVPRRLSDAFPTTASIMGGSSVHTKMPPMFIDSRTSTSSSPKRDPQELFIPIPVQHLGSSAEGLRSPKVLQTLTSPTGSGNNGIAAGQPSKAPGYLQPQQQQSQVQPKILKIQHQPQQQQNQLQQNQLQQNQLQQLQQQQLRQMQQGSAGPVTMNTTSLPSLHAAHVENMRKRFEEAKERINAMHQRATTPPSTNSSNPFDDPFIEESMAQFEQMRRRQRNKQMISAPPHPELTPQQRQHIFERSTSLPIQGFNAQAIGPGGSGNMPLGRRFMNGGSVAERVMIFERCPIFGPDSSKEARMPAFNAALEKKKEPASLTWRNTLQDGQNKAQAGRGNKVIRDIPIATTGFPAASLTSLAASAPASAAAASTSGATLGPSTTSGPLATPVAAAFTPSPALTSTSVSRASSASTSPASTLSRLSRPASIIITGKEKVLPKFHFPFGNPATAPPTDLTKFADEFRKHKNSSVTLEELGQVLKNCGYPLYWKGILFSGAGGEKTGSLSYVAFSDFWRRMCSTHHDEASQMMHMLTCKDKEGKRNYLLPEDFIPLVQDVVDTHPGLGFLKEATEFHSRYVHTVIARIFFVVNRSWSGRVTLGELRRSSLLQTLRLLEDEDDINQVTDFFSYEHFYVIYCKFWELDKDHDLFIDREDLARHNDHAISTRMIDRIFSGAVTRGPAQQEGKMSYTEFVWFLLAEEDKRAPTSIEYWFRCMDLDGDGYLSMYELEYFYEEQLQRMEQLGIETLPFEDCLCQMLDMITPKKGNLISLQDLRSCRMTPIFFDTFFNLEKYLDHEQRDPFASQRDVDEEGNEVLMSDWDRFAAEEYELLVAEEGTAEGMDDLCYEDDPDGNNAEMQLDQALEEDNDMIYNDPMIVATNS